jgi:hypothetical protein
MLRHNYITRHGYFDGNLTSPCVAHLQALLLRKAGQREAVSFVVKELREDGFGGWPPQSFVESAMERAGFTLLRDYTDGSRCVRACYVVAQGVVVEQRFSYRLEYHCGRGSKRWVYRYFRTGRALVRFLKQAARGTRPMLRDEVGEVVRITEVVE